MKNGSVVELYAWVNSVRTHKSAVFVDILDRSGEIQLIVTPKSNCYNVASKLKKGSSVYVEAEVLEESDGGVNLEVKQLRVVGDFERIMSPHPFDKFDIFNEKYATLVSRNRHLYIRNPRIREVVVFRYNLLKDVRNFLDERGFVEVHVPTITELTLYDTRSAFSVDFFGHTAYLSQCSAYYLESLVCPLERVYSILPTFRAEKGRSPRHLAEYWHLKCEIAFMNLDEIISFTEKMIYDIFCSMRKISRSMVAKEVYPPFSRITYREALSILNSSVSGVTKPFGNSLNPPETEIISRSLGDKNPFWIVYPPRNIEPFHYRVNPNDPETVMVADLIAPSGYGEILGVAEKIHEYPELQARMEEKGVDLERYEWYVELTKCGAVPHSGLGMGIERLIRWMMGLRHVRDAILFPREYRKRPRP